MRGECWVLLNILLLNTQQHWGTLHSPITPLHHQLGAPHTHRAAGLSWEPTRTWSRAPCLELIHMDEAVSSYKSWDVLVSSQPFTWASSALSMGLPDHIVDIMVILVWHCLATIQSLQRP